MRQLISTVPNLRWRKDYNFVTIYNFDTDDLFKAPAIAKNILELCDGTRTKEEIVECLVDNKVLNNTVKAKEKMQAYIESLVRIGIIVYI